MAKGASSGDRFDGIAGAAHRSISPARRADGVPPLSSDGRPTRAVTAICANFTMTCAIPTACRFICRIACIWDLMGGCSNDAGNAGHIPAARMLRRKSLSSPNSKMAPQRGLASLHSVGGTSCLPPIRPDFKGMRLQGDLAQKPGGFPRKRSRAQVQGDTMDMTGAIVSEGLRLAAASLAGPCALAARQSRMPTSSLIFRPSAYAAFRRPWFATFSGTMACH